MKNGKGRKYNPLFVFREDLFPTHPQQLTLEDVIREQQEKLREWEHRHRLLKCSYQTTSIEAGDMLEVSIYPSFLHREDYRRAIKEQRTGKTQQKQNLKNAQRKLIRLVHSNFVQGDISFTALFRPENMPRSLSECRKHLKNYFDRLRYNMKKMGSGVLRYIYVIEEKDTKASTDYHVHMIIGRNAGENEKGIDRRDLIEEMWNGGDFDNARRLQKKRTGGFTGIAKYITKQFEELDATNMPGRRRWGQSLGLLDRTAKEKKSLSKFGKRKVMDMVKTTATMKESFEKQFPGYLYPEEYPCEIRYSDVVGGFYLFCRLYRRE